MTDTKQGGDGKMASSVVSQTTTVADDKRQAARVLSERLIKQGYHPVLVFGAASSGKTMMLLSLMRYLSANPENDVTISPGDGIIPSSYPDAETRNEDGHRYFNEYLAEFRSGKVPEKSQQDLPFFVPLHLSVPKFGSSESSYVKLAFLEGQGEWYEMDGPASKFPTFKEEIENILKFHTEKGVSIIFVAPTFSSQEGNTEPAPTQRVNDSIFGLINEVAKHRSPNELDAELFLLSKWDTTFREDLVTEGLAGDLYDGVASHIFGKRGHYREAWAAYVNRAGVKGSRSFMAHASCRVRGSDIVFDAKYQYAFDHFNRTLANWIFGNATQSLTGQREQLFPDVIVSGRNWRSGIRDTYARLVYFSVNGR